MRPVAQPRLVREAPEHSCDTVDRAGSHRRSRITEKGGRDGPAWGLDGSLPEDNLGGSPTLPKDQH